MLLTKIASDTGEAQLPLISVKALKQGNNAQFLDVADAMGEAARTIGFFRICDHRIDPALIEDVYRVAELSTAKQKWAKGQRKMLPLWGCDNHRIDERQHPGSRACPIAGGCPDALARQGQSVLIGV